MFVPPGSANCVKHILANWFNNDSIMAIYISIAGVVISVVGWFVVHVLAVRTQRLTLVNTLRNEARIAIVDSIHQYHDCCTEIIVKASSASVDEVLARAGVASPHIDRSRSLRDACTDTRTHIWLRRLEEFECLFPETSAVRVELLSRNLDALERMRKFADAYERGDSSHESPELEALVDEFFDLTSLAWDLLIYVQNRSIGEITGHQVATRKPVNNQHPLITKDTSGQLIISRR
jgi:hypothetical protein